MVEAYEAFLWGVLVFYVIFAPVVMVVMHNAAQPLPDRYLTPADSDALLLHEQAGRLAIIEESRAARYSELELAMRLGGSADYSPRLAAALEADVDAGAQLLETMQDVSDDGRISSADRADLRTALRAAESTLAEVREAAAASPDTLRLYNHTLLAMHADVERAGGVPSHLYGP